MIYEYAVDPEVMSSVDNCNAVFDNFSPEKGRLISDIPRKWRREAFKALKDIPHEECQPKHRQYLKEKLRKLVGRNGGLCRRPLEDEWNNSKEWMKYVAKANSKYHFEAVISTEDLSSPVQTYTMRTVRDPGLNIWEKHIQLLVKRKAKDMIDAAMPMLRISSEITLVDRYIDPNKKKYKNVLNEIINRSNEFNFGRGIKKVVIYYVSAIPGRKEPLNLKAALDHHFPETPFGLKFECHPFESKFEHDRSIITNIGGLDYRPGLDEYDEYSGKAVKEEITRITLLTTELIKDIRLNLEAADKKAFISGKS